MQNVTRVKRVAILAGRTPEELADMINRNIDNGWELHGQPYATGPYMDLSEWPKETFMHHQLITIDK